MTAHQASLSLGSSRQEHWSGLPFPSPMDESEKWSHSVMSDSSWPHGLQPTRLFCPWDFPGKSTGVGCHCLLPSSNFSQNAYFDTLKQINILKYFFSISVSLLCWLSAWAHVWFTYWMIQQELDLLAGPLFAHLWNKGFIWEDFQGLFQLNFL